MTALPAHHMDRDGSDARKGRATAPFAFGDRPYGIALSVMTVV